MNIAVIKHDVSPAEFRRCLANYCSGITIVTGRDASGACFGMTCQSFHSLSLEPPLVAYFAADTSKSYRSLRTLDRFCVNVLCAEQRALAEKFSRPDLDRWAGTAWSEDAFGQPVLPGCIATISCRSYAEYPGGDHFICVGKVEQMRHDPARLPLLYFRSSFAELERGGDARP